MRISDWSSDVCSSDLEGIILEEAVPEDFFLRPQHPRAKQFLRQLLTPMQAECI